MTTTKIFIYKLDLIPLFPFILAESGWHRRQATKAKILQPAKEWTLHTAVQNTGDAGGWTSKTTSSSPVPYDDRWPIKSGVSSSSTSTAQNHAVPRLQRNSWGSCSLIYAHPSHVEKYLLINDSSSWVKFLELKKKKTSIYVFRLTKVVRKMLRPRCLLFFLANAGVNKP